MRRNPANDSYCLERWPLIRLQAVAIPRYPAVIRAAREPPGRETMPKIEPHRYDVIIVGSSLGGLRTSQKPAATATATTTTIGQRARFRATPT